VLDVRGGTHLHRTILAAVVLATALALAAPAQAARCGKTYSYAGLVSARPANGVRATIEALTAPRVSSGHVAGWVGVGGVGAGPNGETEWIQVGYSGLDGGESHLYYEVTPPNGATRYVTVDREIRPGERHTVAVHEVRGRRAWWRVRVDGRPVGAPVHLPGSHGRWHPVATAESWNAGTGSCNGLAYRFSRVYTSTRSNQRWRRLQPGYTLQDPGYRIARARAGFVARTR